MQLRVSTGQAEEKSDINTSRSNINNLRNKMKAMLNDREAVNAAGFRRKTADLNMQLLALQESLKPLGEKIKAFPTY